MSTQIDVLETDVFGTIPAALIVLMKRSDICGSQTRDRSRRSAASILLLM